jgi:hypothetical protein
MRDGIFEHGDLAEEGIDMGKKSPAYAVIPETHKFKSEIKYIERRAQLILVKCYTFGIQELGYKRLNSTVTSYAQHAEHATLLLQLLQLLQLPLIAKPQDPGPP